MGLLSGLAEGIGGAIGGLAEGIGGLVGGVGGLLSGNLPGMSDTAPQMPVSQVSEVGSPMLTGVAESPTMELPTNPGLLQPEMQGPQMALNQDISKLISDVHGSSSSSVPVEYFHKVADIESRGNPRAVSPTGAKGLFQFTGGTWKQFGKGDRFDPVANTKAAIGLAENNHKFLSRKLGREIKPAELYMAHNIGMGGALKLLTADPNARVSRSLIGSNPYHNPKFFIKGGRPVTAGQAIKNYHGAF